MTSSQRTYKVASERLSAYVRTHGMRDSKVRNSVLEQLCLLPQPFTAAQLEEACQAERISTGTVYNCLELFIMAQILHAIKRQRGKAVMEYELIGSSPVRMEVICRKCGRVTEIHDKAITRLIQERRYTNFTPEQFSLFVYGECRVCSRRKKKE